MSFLKHSKYIAFFSSIAFFLNINIVSAKELIKAQTGSPGSGAYVATVGFDKVVNKNTNYQLQINASQTVTKSMIELAKGNILISPMVIVAVDHMKNQRKMYSKNWKCERISWSIKVFV